MTRQKQHYGSVLAVAMVALVALGMLFLSQQQTGSAAASTCVPRAYCNENTKILLQPNCNQAAIPCTGTCLQGECVREPRCNPVARCEDTIAVRVTPDCRHTAVECGPRACNAGRCL